MENDDEGQRYITESDDEVYGTSWKATMKDKVRRGK